MEDIKTRAREYAKEKVRRFFGEESWLSRVECGVMAESAYKAGATEQQEIDNAKFESAAESYERGFAQGQEVGEREMIDKACKWLTEHTFGGEYNCLSDTTSTTILYHGQRLLSTEFCKAMGDFADANKIADHFPEVTKMLGWQDIARLVDIIGHTANLDKQGQLRPREEYYTEIANRFNESRSQWSKNF